MQWGYGFRVGASQDRNTRYNDATGTNPSITQDIQPQAVAARDQAFGYIDTNSIAAPYVVNASGDYDPQNPSYWLYSVSVRQEINE